MTSMTSPSPDTDGTSLFDGDPDVVPGPRRSAEGFDRVPPQDLEAERSVLGGMELSRDAIADVIEILKGREFYLPAHETIYAVIVEMYGKGEPADPITVAAELTRRGELTRVGGAPTCTPWCSRCRPRRTPRTTPRSSANAGSCARPWRPARASRPWATPRRPTRRRSSSRRPPNYSR
ncbi:DnaB-like helicase N-terminal domain-containing protein [Streptomyces stramineus]